MSDLIHRFDWSATPLGPVEGWPQSLKATVKTLLGSRYPMILLWSEDLIQIYNDAYINLIGDKHPYALGHSIRDTQAESWEVIGPMIHEVISTGTPNWVPAQRLALNRAGFTEEAYFSLSYSAVEDDEAVIRGMLCVCSEVTQQVLGERRLKLQRDLAAKAGEVRPQEKVCGDIAAAISDYPWDVPFALIYLNDSRDDAPLLGAAIGVEAGGEAPGRWPLDRALQGETIELDGIEERLAVAGGPFQAPVTRALVLPLRGAGDTALGALVLGINPNCAFDEAYRSFCELLAQQVSMALRNARAYEEERERADALAALDQAKTAFFSNVSHEFRTPLTLLIGPLEEALATAKGQPEQRKRLTVARRNALRLTRLVNTLLDFSRIEAGRARAAVQPVNLTTLTVDLASNFRSAAEQAGLTLTIACQDLGTPVDVDPDMWEKIVLNLLSNAYKFTFTGEIALTLNRDGDDAVLTVRDTGVGIPRKELPRIFERFHRVEKQRGRSHEGTGIGLALVKELVELHGGTIEVDSVVDEGTRFTIRIPMSSRATAPPAGPTDLDATPTRAETFMEEARIWSSDRGPHEEADADPLPAELDGMRPHILLADDNVDMRAYVSRLLRARFEVTAVADGAAALDVIEERRPDLVLLDVMMPVKNGFEVLSIIRSAPSGAQLPVILLSARAGEEARVEGLRAGADDYLVKPFVSRELVARVEGAIRLAQQRAEAAEREARIQADVDLAHRELALKDSMLAEIHHRVKNNLQFLSSLIALTIKDLADPEAVQRLEDLKGRVLNLGLMHNLLYGVGETPIDAVAFLRALAEESRTAYAMAHVGLEIAADPVSLSADQMVPLGLLLNEALLNAFKYAFDDQPNPLIRIALRRNSSGLLGFSVCDNGSGFGKPRPGSSGLRLMRVFANQLGGELAVTYDKGSQLSIEFPEVRR
ncbi:ATP-binding protein [Agaricicola taiwanensis]|nr:ATP-binding protein [Agaricicola taiwanensis]